jgi:hypothetical protein
LGERRGENWEQSEKLGQEEAVYISYEGGKEFMLADKSIKPPRRWELSYFYNGRYNHCF